MQFMIHYFSFVFERYQKSDNNENKFNNSLKEEKQLRKLIGNVIKKSSKNFKMFEINK
jgi:hypothetical protein